MDESALLREMRKEIEKTSRRLALLQRTYAELAPVSSRAVTAIQEGTVSSRVLKVMEDGQVRRVADLVGTGGGPEAIGKALTDGAKAGVLVRVGRGRYRRATVESPPNGAPA